MNPSLWLGFLGIGGLVFWEATRGSVAGTANAHGVIIVFGGTTAALLAATPFRVLWSAVWRTLNLFMPTSKPNAADAVAAAVALAREAQTGGGLLAIKDTANAVAGGFIQRAVTVAIATGEMAETRKILEKYIRAARVSRQEDANVLRTAAVLSPMFGILGTLLGMVQLLASLTDPSKVGPAMALALSSAVLGIGLANLVFTPLAGQMRLEAMRETQVFEILLEGVLEVQAGRQAYMVELHLNSYLAGREDAAPKA